MNDTNGQSAGKNLAWLAGFLDGDGSVRLNGNTKKDGLKIYVPIISFTNTDALIIEECVRILKENNIGHYLHAKKTVNGMAFDVIVKGFKRSYPLAVLLQEYAVGKKKAELQLLIKWINSRKETGNDKTYTKEELFMSDQILNLHDPSYPQRLHAGLPVGDEDIVRAVQKCAELSRNAIAGLPLP